MNLPVLQRDCLEAGCSLCCELPTVTVLGKPSNTRCDNLADDGKCSIYHDGRPECCKDFQCQWRQDDSFPAHLMPTAVGGYFVVEATVVPRIAFFEKEDGNWKKTPVIEFLQHCWDVGFAVFVYSPAKQPKTKWQAIGFDRHKNGKVFPVTLISSTKDSMTEEHPVPLVNKGGVKDAGGFKKVIREIRQRAKKEPQA